MSNKTIDSATGLTLDRKKAFDSMLDGDMPLMCTKCGASKFSPSRLQRFDGLKMRFISERPYRCLHCYNRFWVKEKMVASRKRVWTLVIVALVFVLLLLTLFGAFSTSEQSERISIIAPDVNEPPVSDNSVPSLASLINMPQQGTATSDAVNSPKAASVQAASNTPQAFAVRSDELLTPQQKAQRLLLAKQESEVAEQTSQARVKQLEQVLLPADHELESLVKVEVGYVVERWREAWSKGNINGYLSSYSPDFTPPNNLTIDAWEAGRRYRVKPEKGIIVELSNFNIAILEELNSGVVEFNQRYQSGSYVENSRKRLSFVKEAGAWKIASEVELTAN